MTKPSLPENGDTQIDICVVNSLAPATADSDALKVVVKREFAHKPDHLLRMLSTNRRLLLVDITEIKSDTQVTERAINEIRARMTEAISHAQNPALSDALEHLGSDIDDEFAKSIDANAVLAKHKEHNVALRKAFHDRTDLLSSVQVAQLCHSRAKNPHALANRWAKEGKIFSVRADRRQLFPTFQFNPLTGSPYPEIKSILDTLRPSYDGWSLAIWFISGNAWLDNQVPLDFWPDQRKHVLLAAQEECALDG